MTATITSDTTAQLLVHAAPPFNTQAHLEANELVLLQGGSMEHRFERAD